jgi:hypothetical protein
MNRPLDSPAVALGWQTAARVQPLQEGTPSGDATLHMALAAPPSGAPGPAAPDGHLLAIIDGLGHGAPAALAAQAALQLLRQNPALPLPQLLGVLDTGLTGTRGAAVGLVQIRGRRLWHAGVGNTRALRWRGDHLLRLPSQSGVVGGGLPANLDLAVTEADLQPGDWLLLFTDGLSEKLDLKVHLPEWARDPQLLCDHLLARWRNPRDDAGVLAFHLAEGAI